MEFKSIEQLSSRKKEQPLFEIHEDEDKKKYKKLRDNFQKKILGEAEEKYKKNKKTTLLEQGLKGLTEEQAEREIERTLNKKFFSENELKEQAEREIEKIKESMPEELKKILEEKNFVFKGEEINELNKSRDIKAKNLQEAIEVAKSCGKELECPYSDNEKLIESFMLLKYCDKDEIVKINIFSSGDNFPFSPARPVIEIIYKNKNNGKNNAQRYSWVEY